MIKTINIKIDNKGCEPLKKHRTDAGHDLRLNQPTVTISPGQTILLHTGVTVEIPSGYAGFVVPRSSLGSKGLNLANTVGVIDSDYRGEIMVPMVNRSESQIKIEKYDRFAQLIIIPVFIGKLRVTGTLTDTTRGTGGFGSTGDK